MNRIQGQHIDDDPFGYEPVGKALRASGHLAWNGERWIDCGIPDREMPTWDRQEPSWSTTLLALLERLIPARFRA
jgi:hypothetical protein